MTWILHKPATVVFSYTSSVSPPLSSYSTSCLSQLHLPVVRELCSMHLAGSRAIPQTTSPGATSWYTERPATAAPPPPPPPPPPRPASLTRRRRAAPQQTSNPSIGPLSAPAALRSVPLSHPLLRSAPLCPALPRSASILCLMLLVDGSYMVSCRVVPGCAIPCRSVTATQCRDALCCAMSCHDWSCLSSAFAR